MNRIWPRGAGRCSCRLRLDILEREEQLFQRERNPPVVALSHQTRAPGRGIPRAKQAILPLAIDEPAQMLACNLVAELVTVKGKHAVMVTQNELRLVGKGGDTALAALELLPNRAWPPRPPITAP